jgi:hypothetical protein
MIRSHYAKTSLTRWICFGGSLFGIRGVRLVGDASDAGDFWARHATDAFGGVFPRSV